MKHARLPRPDSTQQSSSQHVPTCATIAPELRACERRLTPPIHGSESPSRALASLRAHIDACPACATRHGRRLAALEGRDALLRRELPVDSFESFYDEIRERVPFTAPGGGMSAAFLDAPRSLRIWRSAAMAASLLLALGVGFAATGGIAMFGGDTDHVRSLHDPRDHLLPVFDPSSTTWPRQSGFLIRPAHAPVMHGHDAFFEPATPDPEFIQRNGFLDRDGHLLEEDEGQQDARLR